MIKIISTLYTYQLEAQLNDFFKECENNYLQILSCDIQFYKLYESQILQTECHAIISYRKLDFDEI